MRGLVVPRTTGPDAVELREDLPEPEGAHPWAHGERLLVEVRAAAVAFPDLLQSRGAYQHGTPAPYVTGGEYAGVVLEAPPGSRFRTGDRVAGLSVWGAAAERVLAIPRYTVRLPATMSWADGAAFFLNYATAWFTLHRAGFADGESVLVHGAAGGVGTATLDLLRGRAAPSIAVVSSEAKAAVAAECGAEVVLRTDDAWAQQCRDLTGHGVDVVVDPVGGGRFTDSLRALDTGGRLMVVGFAEGAIPEVKVNRLLLRNLSVVGVALDPWEQRFPGYAPELVAGLEAAADQGRVRPYVGHRLELGEARDALGILDRREAHGKVVIDIAGAARG
ncbi:NADPH:quinone oxidoreductase family protein [Nocardioides nitrophenolicus]|uniref:NADPH:quinone oxidoreductase family protein n=1 Tax=Nocardioides nitrophenolicus TaxID=60489 RepID=UPI00195C1CCA|nr:NADPH:quinone oxidoreductase family protein [Nocardioides nitrophenolicus]MBM7517190.1 NADPH2:quinone reductase [Nocardioides nitrophenolicus]